MRTREKATHWLREQDGYFVTKRYEIVNSHQGVISQSTKRLPKKCPNKDKRLSHCPKQEANAQTKVGSSTRSSPETTPETEYVSSLNISKRITRNLQQQQTKGIRAQGINHFYQQAVDYNLDIGVHLFTPAENFNIKEVYDTSAGVVIYLKILSFQQEGRGKPRKDLTLFISPTFR